MPVLRALDLHKRYGDGESAVDAVRGVSLELAAGEFVAVVGPSGCGKSTLLHLCGGMDRPTAGTVVVEGVDLGGLDDEALTVLRRDRVGFVFQFFNLLPTLTLAENIALPLLLAGAPSRVGLARAGEGGRRVGLGHRLEHYPTRVSGGELQRAAIARALVHQPALIIADEPTTALDMTIQAQILELMQGLSTELGTAMILITHNLGVVARYAKRVIVMYAGSIIEEGTSRQIYYDPRHPYTLGLLRSVPRLDEQEGVKLEPIEGLPPNLIGLGGSCNFAPRCRYAIDRCLTQTPVLEAIKEATPPHHAACWRSEDIPNLVGSPAAAGG
jgi:oligopeptide/dipeptide ABC transporter ATP-binding protein